MKRAIITSPLVEFALQTLAPDEASRMRAWFDRLSNWDDDVVARDNSSPLDGMPGVHVLRSSADDRIFFRLEPEKIEILDVSNRRSILASSHVARVG